MAETSPLDELLASHSELRAALIFAGRRISKLNFGRKTDPALPILRRTLRDARKAAKQFKGHERPTPQPESDELICVAELTG